MLRAYLPQLVDMQGFREAWGDVVEVRGGGRYQRGNYHSPKARRSFLYSPQVLCSILGQGRKAASCAAAALITALLQVRGCDGEKRTHACVQGDRNRPLQQWPYNQPLC